MRYVIIDENKIPQHSLDETYTFDEVKDYPNLAVLIEEPFVVLDVDDADEAVKVYDILTEYNIKCNIMKTDRGCHFWFKSREPMTNNIKCNTPITAKVDVKSWGKKSLVTIKKKDVWRQWLTEGNEVEEIPFWLKPIPIKKELMNMDEGDGRDDGLFTYIIPLLKCKFTKHEIEILFNIINRFIFKKPLLQRELDKMFLNNDIFDESLGFYDKKEFLHNEFAFWLNKNYPIEFYNGQLYLYNNGLYAPNISKIETVMIRKLPKLKSAQRVEVLKYLELICAEKTKPPQPLWVNTLGGIVDIEHERLFSHSESIFSINQIPTYYNPGSYDKDVDKFLTSVSGGDQAIRDLLEELIGYCLINDCRLQKAFILVGAGANGKSVFLKMLMNFLGKENVSSIPLEELNGKFESAELVGKLANIGDDISSELLSDSSMFKKLVTGDTITAQRKFQNPFQFNNIAKLVFSANALPPVSDKSYGLQRRLVIIPFNQCFNPDDEGFDRNIVNKLITPSAKMYLLDLGIRAIKRALDNNDFTTSSQVQELLSDFAKENNNCLQWLETNANLDEIEVNDAYKNYCMFCLSNGTKPYKKQRFIHEILTNLVYVRLKNTTRNGGFIQVFSEKAKG